METMHAAGRRRLPPVPRPAAERPAPARAAVATDETNPDQSATQVIDTRAITAELIEAELAALTAAEAERADDDELEATQQLGLAELAALIYDEDDAVADAAAIDDAAIDDAADDDALLEETEEDEPDEPEIEGDPGAPPLSAETPAGDQDPAQQFVARLRSSAADFAGAAGAESAVVREAVPPARHRRARCRLVLRFAEGDVVDVTLLGPAGSPGRPSRHGFDRQIMRWLGAGLLRDESFLVDDPDAPDGLAVDLTAWVATA